MEENLPEIYSEEVREILGNPPRGIVRWGISMIFIIIFLLLTASWFIKYPDIIKAEISITTDNIPASLVARTSGKITNLFVRDGQEVETNDLLAVIENPAKLEDVLLIDSLLSELSLQNDSSVYNFVKAEGLISGDLLPAFTALQKACNDYINFNEVNLHARKIKALKVQLSMTYQYYNRLQEQSNLQKEDMVLARKQFQRDSSLYSLKITSEEEFDRAKSAFLQRRQSYESTKASLTNNQIQLSQLEQQIIEIELQIEEMIRGYKLSIEQAANNLTNSITSWKLNYLFIAPSDGIVTFTITRKINQNVNAGDIVLTIVPKDEMEISGTTILPMQGAGKVKEGQLINVKFHNYPHMEFGMVSSIVKNISLVPHEASYIVEVDFPKGLITNYGKELEFSQGMQGISEIITEDINLLQRVIQPLRALIRKNK